jgi:hypothetical protein
LVVEDISTYLDEGRNPLGSRLQIDDLETNAKLASVKRLWE